MTVSFPTAQWMNKLNNDAKQINVDLSEAILEKLALYTKLLLHWNKTYNLTAIEEPFAILKWHILDSLTIVPYVIGPNILDVGSGAGFPGIPLALALPQFNFVLLDSNSKKVHFLRHVILKLSLPNVTVFQERAEKFNYHTCFDTIVTRATSSILTMVSATKHLCCTNGRWLFMKGKYPENEIQEMTNCKFTVTITKQCLKIPGEDASRHLICVVNE